MWAERDKDQWPTIEVTNLEYALSFYAGVLDFEVELVESKRALLRQGEIIVYLEEVATLTKSIEGEVKVLYLPVDWVQKFFLSFVSRGGVPLSGLVSQLPISPSAHEGFYVADPDGTIVCFFSIVFQDYSPRGWQWSWEEPFDEFRRLEMKNHGERWPSRSGALANKTVKPILAVVSLPLVLLFALIFLPLALLYDAVLISILKLRSKFLPPL